MRFPGKKCVKTMKKIGNVSKKPLDKNEPEIGFLCLNFLFAHKLIENLQRKSHANWKQIYIHTVVNIRNRKKCIADKVVANIGVSVRD